MVTKFHVQNKRLSDTDNVVHRIIFQKALTPQNSRHFQFHSGRLVKQRLFSWTFGRRLLNTSFQTTALDTWANGYYIVSFSVT